MHGNTIDMAFNSFSNAKERALKKSYCPWQLSPREERILRMHFGVGERSDHNIEPEFEGL
jgi:DNA-directed RNA polymerase sigma subunit (sigma70/sigma32)